MVYFHDMAGDLRSEECSQRYKECRASNPFGGACALCAKTSTKTFAYWKIVPNDFPYDRIADVHEMIVPLRHVTENELSQEELAEYKIIKQEHLQEYDYILEGTHKTKSIPEHFHLHLIVGKEVV